MLNIDDLNIRPVSIHEADQFIFLLNKTYSRKKTVDYFKWQYFDTPLKTALIGAFLSNKLIGCFGLQCRMLNNGLVGGQIIDIVVEEEYRGKGIFSEMANYAFDYFRNEMDFGFILPNVAGRQATEKALSWKNLYTIKTLMCKSYSRVFERDSNITVIDDWSNIVLGNKKDSLNMLYFVREKEYLQWRFGKNPEYRYVIIKRDDFFVVAKTFIDPVTGGKFGDIVDFGYGSKNLNPIRAIFISAINYFIESGIEEVTTWAFPHTPVYTILKNIGFAESQQERYFCLKPFRPHLDYLNDINNWFLIQADSEIY